MAIDIKGLEDILLFGSAVLSAGVLGAIYASGVNAVLSLKRTLKEYDSSETSFKELYIKNYSKWSF